MPEVKWKSPLEDWKTNNEDSNLAFTFVARNEAARQMWADPHNSARHVPASFTREGPGKQSLRQNNSAQPESKNGGDEESIEKEKATEPALQFLFNNWPKDLGKGFVLGSCDKLCDALLGDTGNYTSDPVLAFTFNQYHELIMNVTTDDPTWVKYERQKQGKRNRFTWIFPRGQETIRVNVANILELDVVLPKYGTNIDKFHDNCASFLSLATCGNLVADGLEPSSIAVTPQASGTISPQEPFYLRGKVLGSGTYGDVYKVLRMPDGKIFAAKRFKYKESFRQKVDMLKMVCKTYHKNIVQFVEEWHGDYKPLLIMEYVAGGNLVGQIIRGPMGHRKIANLAGQTLAALVFLHDQGVMHRDIKPANILCVTPDHYKLADFGVSKEVAPLLSKQGTVEYMAPEVHDLTPYSYSADIWSLGVVLFECMGGLPSWRPGMNGRKWCEEVLRRCERYYWRCVHVNASDKSELAKTVKNAMLLIEPDDRLSARRCLEDYRNLWPDLKESEDSEAESGTTTPTQAHPNGSFPPNPLEHSEGDDAGEETSSTARWNSGGTPNEGREPRYFRNEDRTTVTTHSVVGKSLQGSLFPSPTHVDGGKIYDPSNVIPWPTSISGGIIYDPDVTHPSSIEKGTLYDPGRVISSVLSMSETEEHRRSISEGSIKRRRDSHASAEGVEEDGSVTPGRRAPYHPGNEVAAPGLDYFPANHRMSSRTSNPKRIKSSVSDHLDSEAQ